MVTSGPLYSMLMRGQSGGTAGRPPRVCNQAPLDQMSDQGDSLVTDIDL